MQIKKDGYGRDHESVGYWLNHRSSIGELYKSELHFFEYAMRQSKRVLDIGCAAGGGHYLREKFNQMLNTLEWM